VLGLRRNPKVHPAERIPEVLKGVFSRFGNRLVGVWLRGLDVVYNIPYTGDMERMQIQVLVLGAVAFAGVGAFGALRMADALLRAVF
jgi:hypothetical protein